MAAPLGPDTPTRDQRPPRRRGAVAAAGKEDPGRRRRLAALLLLGVLILAGAIAGIVAAVTGSHHHTSAAGSASAQATSSGSASAQASPAGGGAGTLPAFRLVGGGRVTPRSAAGNLAVTGSIGDVLFAEDGTALDQNARQVISTAAREIQHKHAGTVTVIGYTDAIGNATANQQLSLARAQAVVTALRADVGGTAVTYHAEARGQSKPVATNSAASGRQLNRRVVITTP